MTEALLKIHDWLYAMGYARGSVDVYLHDGSNAKRYYTASPTRDETFFFDERGEHIGVNLDLS